MRITKSILALMAATMTFAACSNDEKITESTPKTVALTVKLPEFGGASSRAIDPETTTGNKVTINGPVKIIARVSQGGAITNTISENITAGSMSTITVSGAAQWIEVEESRSMDFLDGSRSPEYPDDVLVYLLKDGNKPEGCWVRIEGLADHEIIGTLLNEPDQNFDYHEGETIAFYAQQTEDKEIVLYSNMNPSTKIAAEDLEDGTMLEAAIHTFNEERTEEHLLDIMEILRDSYVWIPCNAVISDADQARLLAMLEEKEDGIIGEEFVTHGETRLIPDILQNGDNFFFPVFSNEEAMGEYGKSFSKVQKHFLEALVLAKNNEKDLAGIVINAFSEPYVLEKEIWALVEKMKSRIQ